MNAKIKERKRGMMWLNIERVFYKGLAKALSEPEHVKKYYKNLCMEKYYEYLHWHINYRAEWDKKRGH